MGSGEWIEGGKLSFSTSEGDTRNKSNYHGPIRFRQAVFPAWLRYENHSNISPWFLYMTHCY